MNFIFAFVILAVDGQAGHQRLNDMLFNALTIVGCVPVIRGPIEILLPNQKRV